MAAARSDQAAGVPVFEIDGLERDELSCAQGLGFDAHNPLRRETFSLSAHPYSRDSGFVQSPSEVTLSGA